MFTAKNIGNQFLFQKLTTETPIKSYTHSRVSMHIGKRTPKKNQYPGDYFPTHTRIYKNNNIVYLQVSAYKADFRVNPHIICVAFDTGKTNRPRDKKLIGGKKKKR